MIRYKKEIKFFNGKPKCLDFVFRNEFEVLNTFFWENLFFEGESIKERLDSVLEGKEEKAEGDGELMMWRATPETTIFVYFDELEEYGEECMEDNRPMPGKSVVSTRELRDLIDVWEEEQRKFKEYKSSVLE